MKAEPLRENLDRLATAWDWVLRLRDDATSQDDLAAWLQWYEADERHKAAFEEMQAFWHEAGRVQEEPKIRGAPPRTRMRGEKPAKLRRALVWGGIPLAAAASVALAVWSGWFASPSSPTVREQHLPDGSVLQLAARSVVDVRFTSRERVLEMRNGEAYFSVVKNPSAPFIVKVGDAQVRAVGTAFNIRRAGERVVVTVTEGAVDLIRGAQRTRATAGEQLALDGQGSGIRKTAVDTAHALAWRKGRLEYLNEPLRGVIADVNRYCAHRVVIDDEAVGGILFSGTVFTGAADAWVQALPQVFPIRLRVDAAGAARLTRAPPEAQ